MLDIDKIRQLVDMMMANDLAEISLRDGEVEVNLRRPAPGSAGPVVTGTPAASVQMPTAASAAPPVAPAAAQPPKEAGADADAGLVPIKSPMVGTFYAAPDPDSSAYVQIGSAIGTESVVCIVEAMKVFNEIKAEVSGTIEKILVKNEQPVEYGQPMFLVRPD